MTNNKTVSKKRRTFRTSKSKRKVKINRRSKRKTKTNIKRKSTKRKSTKRKYLKKKIMKGGDIQIFKADPDTYYTQFEIGDYLNKNYFKKLFTDSKKINDTQLMLFEELIENKFYSLLFENDILTLYKVNAEGKSEIVWEIITENNIIKTIQVNKDNILTM